MKIKNFFSGPTFRPFLHSLIIVILFPLAAYSQQTAYFETTLYFEDAVGNRDSVIVGHDENANAFYNPDFGEVDIELPWDSVFEVRAAHFLDFHSIFDDLTLSKKIIGSNEGGIIPSFGCLAVNEPIVLFVNIKHLPLRVWWNQGDFKNSICRNRSLLEAHLLSTVSPLWYEDSVAVSLSACMAEDSIFEASQFDKELFLFGFYLIDEIEGGVEDTIDALLLDFRFQGAIESPCTSRIVSVDDAYDERRVNIFPNPTSGHIELDCEGELEWKVFDSIGRIIEEGTTRSIDLSNEPKGLYYISLFDRRKTLIETRKVVKME